MSTKRPKPAEVQKTAKPRLAWGIALTVLLVSVVLILFVGCDAEQAELSGGAVTAEQAAMDYVRGTYLLDYDCVCAVVHPAMDAQTRASIDTVAAQFAEYSYEFGNFTLGEVTQGSEADCRSCEKTFEATYGESITISDLCFVDVDFEFTVDGVSDGNFVTATVAKIDGAWFVIDRE